MTENEALEELQTSIELAKMCTQNYERKREIQGYEMAIKALKEVQQYRAIGTVEECRAAVKKQTAKKLIKSKEQKIRYVNTYYCPTCNLGFTGFNIAKWCYHCGQKLDWSDE